MISNNKIFAYMDRIVGDQTPITADVFLSDVCNNACPYCTYKRHSDDIIPSKEHFMSFEQFNLYADILLNKGIQGIILTGGGEPTLNPDFKKITEWLENNEIHYGINTNFNIYYEFAPDYLKISLDGYDRESYKQIRGVDAYDKVIENIKKYCQWKQKNNIKTKVGLQILVSDVSQISRFYSAHKNLPVDYFNFRPNEDANFHYDNQALSNIHYALNYLKQTDNRVVINYKWWLLDHPFKQCYAHWSQLALNHKGEVLYCCHKPNEIIGHICENDILNKHKKATYNPFSCDVPCRLSGPNIALEEISNIKEDIYFI